MIHLCTVSIPCVRDRALRWQKMLSEQLLGVEEVQ